MNKNFFLGNKEVQLSLFVWLVSHRLPILSKKVFITKRRKTITLLRLNLGLSLKVNCINTLSHSNWQCKNKGSLILCASIWTKIMFMSIRKAVDKGVFRPALVSKSYQICQWNIIPKWASYQISYCNLIFFSLISALQNLAFSLVFQFKCWESTLGSLISVPLRLFVFKNVTLVNSRENTCARDSRLVKLQTKPTTLLKESLWHRCFSVNFAKTPPIPRTPFPSIFKNTFF